MKNCLDCGAEAPDEAQTCEECGREFIYFGTGGSSDAIEPYVEKRPDGSVTMAGGGIAIGLGLILILVAFNSRDAGPSLGMIVCGAGLAQLGLTFWLAGYIVKAISFLPGRNA
ncbi:MAG: hypothetical protein QOH86_1587 [Sphingomonadales bacterium]|jgi:hypothetical protein|nr:hypothetical protein [Sphingomonadales bacterium]